MNPTVVLYQAVSHVIGIPLFVNENMIDTLIVNWLKYINNVYY